MAVELKFKRSDNNTPWGFRLAGGIDCELPLTVIKVKECSIAEKAGLRVGDVIVRINDTPITGLTHEQVHDVIFKAGDQFVLVVQREEKLIKTEDDTDDFTIEVDKETILRNLRNLELQNSKNQNASVKQLSNEINDEKIAEVISGQSELLPEQNVIGVNFNNVDLSHSKVVQALNNPVAEKKWSTFLQKPKGPIPKKKESEVPKYPPYNPFKLPEKPREPEIPAESTNVEKENINVENCEEDVSSICSENLKLFTEEQQIDITEGDQETNTAQNIVTEFSEEEQESENEAMSEEYSEKAKSLPVNVSPSLEEQLAEVQKQLLALSHLPSSIQSTIDAVTQQLSKIATEVTRATSQKAESSVGEQQEINDEEFSERAESIEEEESLHFTHSDGESEDLGNPEKNELQNNEFICIDNNSEKNEFSENEPKQITEENEPKDIIEDNESEGTIEDDDRLTQQPSKSEKQRKEVGQLKECYQRRIKQGPTRALAPIQRPIVLPGGRRWTQPDDAVSAAKPKKMTDEKIAETIETYSEVIAGKLKGINFLKYTPPPKNLDYLQNSEVFRLLHEMDPPPRRGIAARPERIPAVQDIYEKRTGNRGDASPVGVRR